MLINKSGTKSDDGVQVVAYGGMDGGASARPLASEAATGLELLGQDALRLPEAVKGVLKVPRRRCCVWTGTPGIREVARRVGAGGLRQQAVT